MPPSTRRQAASRSQRYSEVSAAGLSDDLAAEDEVVTEDELDEHVVDAELQEAFEEIPDDQPDDPPFPPPGLKEISSLASWTVTTAKPGNGVAALRSPDLNQFWQSDGPQPHLLSIHFFKLVSIVHMRIFLDFESDESYTPTKIQFLAGMGAHDVQEFAEMTFEQPTGWIDVDFSNVGPIEQDEDEENLHEHREIDWSKRPVLRAFVVQVRILENHQNGKDTHLRAVQIFARDEAQGVQRGELALGSRSANALPVRSASKAPAAKTEGNNIKLADWMLEPDLR
ncbi:hypothetical protein Q7P37_010395 [Cladosporium fusiforme]